MAGTGTYIDSEGIREALLDLGDEMDKLGFPAVLESMEGAGRVGKALKNPRYKDQVEVLAKYLKRVAQQVKAENDARPGQPHVLKAMQALRATWANFKDCVG